MLNQQGRLSIGQRRTHERDHGSEPSLMHLHCIEETLDDDHAPGLGELQHII